MPLPVPTVGLANWFRKQLTLQSQIDKLWGALRYQQRVIERQTIEIALLKIELQRLLNRPLISQLPDPNHPAPPDDDDD